jgi:hypothetical protein
VYTAARNNSETWLELAKKLIMFCFNNSIQGASSQDFDSKLSIVENTLQGKLSAGCSLVLCPGGLQGVAAH